MPQAGATPQIKVVYNSFNFDDTTGILIDAVDELADAYTKGTFSFEFTLRVTSPSSSGSTATDLANDIASFRTLLANLVTACRVQRGRLQVLYGGTAAIDENPTLGSSLTAFHIVPELTPLPSGDDSLTAKRFRLKFSFDHPADLAGQDGRQDSETNYDKGIRGRRTQAISAVYTALTSNSALAQYQASTTNTWFLAQLQTPVAGGEWELVSETLSWDDEGGGGGGGRVLKVTRVYFEAVNGLREFTATKNVTDSQAISVTLAGLYIPTSAHSSAKAAHDADVGTLIPATLSALYPGVVFDAKPSAASESETTVDGMYPFSVTFDQIVFPQGPSGNDDANVVRFTLAVRRASNFDAWTVVPGAKPQSFDSATALYSAAIDIGSAGGLDMNTLWQNKYKAHCANAIKTKLNAANLYVKVQDLGLDLTANRINAVVQCVIQGGNVVSLLISEELNEVPAGNPVPMTKTPHAYFLFWGTARLTLTRVAQCEFIAGTTPPVFWQRGALASGVPFTDTGWDSWESARDAVNNRTFKLAGAAPAVAAGGTVDKNDLAAGKSGGWYPLSKRALKTPRTVGDAAGINTDTRGITESWLYMAACDTAPAASSQGAPTTTGTPQTVSP